MRWVWVMALGLSACGSGFIDVSTRDTGGVLDDEDDRDGDGVEVPVDCDDSDPLVFPGATERCNGADDDCDGEIDELSRLVLFSMSSGSEVMQVTMDGTDLGPLLTGIQGPHALVVSEEEDTVWYSRWDAPVVSHTDLGGSYASSLYEGDGSGGQGLAVDLDADLMFWGEYYGHLWMGSPDGQAAPVPLVQNHQLSSLVNDSLDGVGMGVEVDPEKERVYFFSRSNSSSGGRWIFRVRYDGSGLQALRQVETSCMDLDLEGGWIYFYDLVDGHHQMWRMALNGKKATKLFELEDDQDCSGVGVDPESGRLVYNQPQAGHVWSCEPDGSDHRLLATVSSPPEGVAFLSCEP